MGCLDPPKAGSSYAWARGSARRPIAPASAVGAEALAGPSSSTPQWSPGQPSTLSLIAIAFLSVPLLVLLGAATCGWRLVAYLWERNADGVVVGLGFGFLFLAVFFQFSLPDPAVVAGPSGRCQTLSIPRAHVLNATGLAFALLVGTFVVSAVARRESQAPSSRWVRRAIRGIAAVATCLALANAASGATAAAGGWTLAAATLWSLLSSTGGASPPGCQPPARSARGAAYLRDLVCTLVILLLTVVAFGAVAVVGIRVVVPSSGQTAPHTVTCTNDGRWR